MMHGRENSGIMDTVGYAPEKHTFAECPLFPVCTAGCVQSLGAQFFFHSCAICREGSSQICFQKKGDTNHKHGNLD